MAVTTALKADKAQFHIPKSVVHIGTYSLHFVAQTLEHFQDQVFDVLRRGVFGRSALCKPIVAQAG